MISSPVPVGELPALIAAERRELADVLAGLPRADRCARRDAAASPDELTAALRDNAAHPRKPPGAGLDAALTHDVIHGLDITTPWGVDLHLPEATRRTVLATITSPASRKHFGVDLDGIELHAEDIDWSYGTGPPVIGTAQHLALILCGRTLAAGQLRGEPGPRFTRA